MLQVVDEGWVLGDFEEADEVARGALKSSERLAPG